jgi:AraC family ethanolamine operon transcriptional activator
MKKVVSADFDEIAHAINGVVGQFVPTARSTASWFVQIVGAGQAAAQILQVGGPTTFDGDGERDAITMGIPLTLPSRIHLNGEIMRESSFLLVAERQPFTVAAREMMRWAGITVPLAYGHYDIRPDGNRFAPGAHVHTSLSHLTQLKALIARLCIDNLDAPPFTEAAALSAEQEIVALASLVMEASGRAETRSVGRPRCNRNRIIQRALELLEDNVAKAISIRDLCVQTGVSERTLRNVFLEQFGVGPIRLLQARRMCAVRAELLQASPGGVRISEVARRYGVWDLSTFGQHYKQLFGELPSQTLRRVSTAPNMPLERTATWLRLAGMNPSQDQSR